MATNQEKLELIISAKDQATKLLDGLKNKIIGVGTAYLGWTAITDFFKNSIKAALESEKVYANLAASIERHGGSWRNLERDVIAFTSTIQRSMNVADEVSAEGLQKLIDAGNTTADAMRGVKIAADVAAGAHIDFSQALDVVAKSSVGITRGLSQLNIKLDESISPLKRAEAAWNILEEKYNLAAQAEMETTAGKIKSLGLAWGEVEKAIGKVIVAQKDVPDLLKFFSDGFNEMAEAINRGTYWRELFLSWVIKSKVSIGNWAAAMEAANELAALQDDRTKKSATAYEDLTNQLNSWIIKQRSFAIERDDYEEHIEAEIRLYREWTAEMQAAWDAQPDMTADQFNAAQEYSHGWRVATDDVMEDFGEYATYVQGVNGEIVRTTLDSLNEWEATGAEVVAKMTEAQRFFANTMVDSTYSAVSQTVNQLQLLTTQSHGFFKQMGVNFVNEFIRRAMTALITSGLLRLFGGIFGGGIGAVIGGQAPIGGGGDVFGGSAFGAAGVNTGISDSIAFSVANRSSNILTQNQNLTGRSLVQFR